MVVTPQSLRLMASGLAAMFLLTVIGMLTWLVLRPRPITFNVTANTERVEFFVDAKTDSRWVLEDVELFRDHQQTGAFSGAFQLGDQVDVIIQRIAFGPLWVHVQSRTPDGTAGMLFSEAEDPIGPAGRSMEIIVRGLQQRADSGRTVILALTGRVKVGRTAGFETETTNPVLRSGKVTMLGRALLGGRVFNAGTVELDTGDQIEVQEPAAAALGFVLADERPGLTAAYRAVGRRAEVSRPGGGLYNISISLLTRIVREPLVQGASILLGGLLSIVALLGFAIEVAEYRREPKSSNSKQRTETT